MLIFSRNMAQIIAILCLAVCFFVKSAHSLNNQSSEMLYLQGLINQKQGDHTAALDCYERVVKSDKQAGWAYIGMGECYLILGEYGRAIKPLNQAAALLPGRVDAYLGLAEAYEQQEAWEMAKEAYLNIIKCDPELMGIYHNLGLIYFELEAWEQAMASFDQELEIDPYSPETYYMKGLAYSQQEEWVGMAEALQTAAQMSGVDNYDIYHGLGFAYRKLGKFKEAEKAYQKAKYLKNNY